jgi:hypothetical protein
MKVEQIIGGEIKCSKCGYINKISSFGIAIYKEKPFPSVEALSEIIGESNRELKEKFNIK